MKYSIPKIRRTYIVWFIAGFAVSWVIASGMNTHRLASLYDQFAPLRAADASYPLINALLTYNVPETKEFAVDTKLEKSLNSFAQEHISNHTAEAVSLYYRDLLSGHWVGIDPYAPYNPASLMKIAIVIAYEREAETHPAVLQRYIMYTKELADALKLVPLQTPSELVVGRSYTVQDLIERLMINSDNGAKNTLLSRLDASTIAEVYSDLGITNPDSVGGNYMISAKAYSLFFRILYNATYLSKATSEYVLELLTKAQFHDGIVAGVPAHIEVAQKFGEFIKTSADGSPLGYELHDCGIVYKPDHPYLLCAMTRGKDIEKLTTMIKDISKLVYQQTP